MSTAVATKLETAPAVQNEAAAIFSMIERISSDPSIPIDRVEQAFAFYQKVQADQARRAFDNAMASAKAEIKPIIKNRTVSHDTKTGGRKTYKHEDLAQIASSVDPVLSKFGLSYRFRTTSNINEPVAVTCIVSHQLGYSEENTLCAGRDDSGNKNSIQAIGSTITYLQRYTLKAALGLAAAHDDDGSSADAGDVITGEQSETLCKLISETNTDLGKFLEVAKAESVSDVLAKDFNGLVALLKKKMKAVQQ